MTIKIESLIRMRVQKMEWTMTFVETHKKTFTAQNIKGGFRGTGIHPFLPSKVLNHVSRSETPESKTSSIFTIIMSFTEIVLTSSPLDINAVRTANMVLNQLIQSGEPLPTPAKNYVHCVIRSSERLYVAKTI